MKCPFSKIVTYSRLLDGWYYSTRELANRVTEEFYECDYEECAAYDNGKCLMVHNKEYQMGEEWIKKNGLLR